MWARGRLGDVGPRVHHRDLGDLLAALLLAAEHACRERDILVFWPVKLAVEAWPPVFEYTCVSSTKHLDVHAAGEHARQGLEADVVHGAVAADDPERLVPSSPSGPSASARRWRRSGRSRRASSSTAPCTGCTGRSRCRRCCSRSRRRCPTARRTSSRWRRTSCAGRSPRRSRHTSRPRRCRCASAP